MEADKERQLAGYWLGIEILDRLANAGDRLTSAEVAALLGVRNVKGIGRALSQTRESLALSGIRFDEAVHRRAVGGRTEWFAGPRIRQARHVLEHQRRFWTGNPADVPVADVGSGHAGGVLVLRALTTNGTVYRIDGGMAELDAILDDDWFDRDDEGLWSIGEVSIHRIETADGGSRQCPNGTARTASGYAGTRTTWIRAFRARSGPGATHQCWPGSATPGGSNVGLRLLMPSNRSRLFVPDDSS